MVISAGNLLSAIGRGAFVNSSTELYSQLKDRSKDVDAESGRKRFCWWILWTVW